VYALTLRSLMDSKHVMPVIEDLVMGLRGSIVFSHLNLKKGYNQVEIAASSRKATGNHHSKRDFRVYCIAIWDQTCLLGISS
jgi:hypothetical protein